MKRAILVLTAVMAMTLGALSQPSVKKVQLFMIPDHADAIYKVGEPIVFDVMALDCGLTLKDITVDYEISEDLMPTYKKGSLQLDGKAKISAGKAKKPGYVRVKASVKHEGNTYTSMTTVGVEPEKLLPTVSLPDDFDDFWGKGLEQLKKVELKPKMELLPERCTEKVDVYHVSYGNIGGSRMYGVLTMPKAEGQYPAILRFPGAGVGEKGGDVAHAAQGVIVLELGIHGVPVTMKGSVYSDLSNGILSSYYTQGIDNRYSYFYRRVYLGCVKGIDFLQSLPQCNGKIGTLGGSQGGALSIAVSRLDERVLATAVYFPALCDQEGYVHGRAGGWPHVFKYEGNRTKEKMETVRYYDTANFARGLKSPVYFAYGYNDITCAPTTTRATYNVITAPKTLSIGENIGHWLYPEQNNAMWNWIIEELKK